MTARASAVAGSGSAAARSLHRPSLLDRLLLGRRPWVLLFLAATLPYLPALRDGFVFDDPLVIEENKAVWSTSPGEAWTHPYWPGMQSSGLYRPWTTFSYWMEGHIFGRHPSGFHAANLLLHALVTLVLWRLLRRLFPDHPGAALAASLLFGVHPLHTEGVVSIVGQAEIWAALGGLLAYLLALRFAVGEGSTFLAGASALAFALAVLSKESAVGLLLLPLAHGAMPEILGPGRRRKPWFALLGLWTVPVLVLFALRLRVLGGVIGLERALLSDNVLAHVSTSTRILSAFGFQWILLLRLVLPWHLSADYSYPQLVPSKAWMLSGALLALLGAALLVVALLRRDRPVVWGLLVLLASGALTSNVLLPIGTVLAERLAYLPLAGSLWIGTIWLARLRERIPRPAGRALLGVALLWGFGLAARSFVRAPDWKDNTSLFLATSKTSPRSAKIRSNLAACLLLEDKVPEGLAQSEIAWKLYPGNPGCAQIRAEALSRAGRNAEALQVLLPVAAAKPAPPKPEFYLELGNIYLELKRGAEADSAFAQAARRIPHADHRTAIGHASALAMQSRWGEAKDAWGKAADLKPKDTEVLRSWAYALWQAGEVDSAAAIYEHALEMEPEKAANSNDVAWFLARTGRDLARAARLARQAFAARPDANTADTVLESLLAAEGCTAARSWADSLHLGRAGPDSLWPAVSSKLEARCPPGAGDAP